MRRAVLATSLAPLAFLTFLTFLTTSAADPSPPPSSPPSLSFCDSLGTFAAIPVDHAAPAEIATGAEEAGLAGLVRDLDKVRATPEAIVACGGWQLRVAARRAGYWPAGREVLSEVAALAAQGGALADAAVVYNELAIKSAGDEKGRYFALATRVDTASGSSTIPLKNYAYWLEQRGSVGR